MNKFSFLHIKSDNFEEYSMSWICNNLVIFYGKLDKKEISGGGLMKGWYAYVIKIGLIELLTI